MLRGRECPCMQILVPAARSLSQQKEGRFWTTRKYEPNANKYFSEGSWKHLKTFRILSPMLRDWMLLLHQMLPWFWRCCAYPIQQDDHFKNHFNDHFKSCKSFFVVVFGFVSTFVLPFSETLLSEIMFLLLMTWAVIR